MTPIASAAAATDPPKLSIASFFVMPKVNHSSSRNATTVQSPTVTFTAMDEFKDRLKKALDEKGVKVQQLADALGISYQGVRKALLGETKSFDAANNSKAADFLGVDPGWLATGRMSASRAAKQPVSVYELEEHPAIKWVKQLSNRLGAGDAVLLEADCVLGVYPVPVDILDRHAMTPEDGRVLRVEGSSMSPWVDDGGIVLVNTSDKQIRNGDVYAVRTGESAIVKRLFRQMDGRIRVQSYNPDYPTEFFTPNDLDAFILGRVVWRNSSS